MPPFCPFHPQINIKSLSNPPPPLFSPPFSNQFLGHSIPSIPPPSIPFHGQSPHFPQISLKCLPPPFYRLLRGITKFGPRPSPPPIPSPTQFTKFILSIFHSPSEPSNSPKMDEPNFYCLCKSTHVLTAARWIGILGSIGCALGLAVSLIGQSLAGVLMSLATAPFYVSLLYAHHQHEPRLYLPFLVVNGLQTCVNALYIIFLVGMLIFIPKFWQHHLVVSIGSNLSLSSMRHYTALVLFGIALLQLILCWFQSVVHHAYKYMCEEQITLIPPQLSPTFEPNTKKEHKFGRESQLA